MEGSIVPAFDEFDGLRISSMTGLGLDELVGRMSVAVGGAREAEKADDGFVIHRPIDEGISVERLDGGSIFVVHGRAAKRAVSLSDLTNLEALDYARHRLERLGVNAALVRAGARNGDTIRIGDFEFDYEED